MVKEDVDYCRMSNLKSGSIDDDPRIRAVDCDHMSTVVLQKKGNVSYMYLLTCKREPLFTVLSNQISRRQNEF